MKGRARQGQAGGERRERRRWGPQRGPGVGRPGGDAVSVKVSALDPRQRRSRQHLRDELSPAFSFYGQK